MKRFNAVFAVAVLILTFIFCMGPLFGEEQEQVPDAVSAGDVADKVLPKEPGKLSHESGLGIALSGGNTDAKTINVNQTTKYEWSKNLLRLDALFFWTYSAGATTARNWMGGLRYERSFSDRFSGFLGHSWEGDKFAGYDYRANGDIGVKYFIWPGDKKDNYFFNETGYRFTYEDRIAGVIPTSSKLHFVRVYFEAAKSLTDSIFAKLWVELLPDVTNKENMLINFEPSLSVKLIKFLSLKLSYLGKFDNEPASAGLRKYDWLYLTSLVAKF